MRMHPSGSVIVEVVVVGVMAVMRFRACLGICMA